MFLEYQSVLLPSVLVIFMVVLQSLIATVAHRKQQQYVPGIVDSNLSHESFVFRSNRTFLNSLENVPVFVLSVIFAMFVGVDSGSLSNAVWVYLAARVIHMVLYYVIATEKNPSPRSYFYMIAIFAQLYVLVISLLKLAS
ncbi:MAG: MAPEG family protein [Gammaproteobacteria bacterium]|nr:MAPEG family protein [Gammaproteobacteria bacterium]